LVWLQFVYCLVLIVISGSFLSRYGDIIAEKTGMGRIFVGIVLLATLTSLPEIATGISAVTLVGEPDLAIGDLFGAGLINLAIIAVIDAVYTRGPVLHRLGNDIVLATVLSIVLFAFAAASILLAHGSMNLNLYNYLSLFSLVLLILYLFSQYVLYRFKSRQSSGQEENISINATPLRKAVLVFLICGVVIVGAGVWLGFLGDQIADATGLKASFVGTLFLAISTTAPEMVVSITAARMGALDMAVANIVGSNLFNIGIIIFIDDLFFQKGPVFEFISPGHVLTALFALMMSGLVILGIVFKPKLSKKSWVGLDTVLIGVVYIAAMLALYFYGH